MQKIAGLKRFNKFLLLFTLLLISPLVYSQNNNEIGSQSIVNYTPKECDAGLQNWAIAQNKNGIMYFGNTVGLLEFDAAIWRHYKVPNKSTVRSLSISKDGKIYTGAVGDLGYFYPDSSGRLIFHSLMKFVPKNKRDFSDVWETYVGKGKVYFNTNNYLL